MPGGIHLLIGLLLTLFINFFLRRSKSSNNEEDKESKNDKENMKLGLVFGSVFPDVDIPVVVVVISFTYLFMDMGLDVNREIAELIHRSLTHSFFILFPLLFYVMYKYHYQGIRTQRILGVTFNLPFAFGCVLSMIIHSISDTCYMKGVRMFWPFYNEEIFFEVPSLGLYDFQKFGPLMQKFLLTADHVTEVMFYCLLMWARHRMHHSNVENLGDKKSRTKLFRDYNLIRIGRELSEEDWQTIFRYVCIIQTILVSVWFALGVYVVPAIIGRELDYVEYFVFLYFPATAFLIISLLAPLCFGSVIRRFDWTTVIYGRSAKRYADGASIPPCDLSCCSSSIKQE
jgi:membrane-bound metal-dependent hydrolase YbcI (DUF457 family)